MTTYGQINAYDMFLEIRDSIGESSAAHWNNRTILRKMIQAQRRLWQQLCEEPDDWFTTSANLTPSSSVVTLPDDCAKPVYMEDKSTGAEIPLRGTVRERRLGRPEASGLYSGVIDAYALKDSIEINVPSYSNQVTLWYVQRLRDLHFGEAGAASASNLIEFDNGSSSELSPHYEDDYYNNAEIEVQSSANAAAFKDTITDYVASSRLATITNTGASGQFYGTVPQIPEEGHYLMIAMVVQQCLAKPGSDIDPTYLNFWRGEVKSLKEDWSDWIARRIGASRHIRITEIE